MSTDLLRREQDAGLHTPNQGDADLAPQASLQRAVLQRKLQRRAVQRHGGSGGSTDAVHRAAEAGIQGGGGSLPYLEQIQSSFGPHDVRGTEAHVGGPAAKATQDMGALAYATGNHVAFGSTPDLHTAAHEAAHVVQQRGGVHLKDGVGSEGDAYEQHADAVADRVVRGESAVDLLSGSLGQAQGRTTAVQHKKKTVTGKAMARIKQARDAISHAKTVFAFGAGNQYEALQASNFNSYFRMRAMRDPSCWELASSVRALAAANPEALTAAKADLAHGGNCGEHAQVGFDYLRAHATGETINRSSVEGLDHAFVIMGDVASEADGDLVVCDPWPTQATACTWEDHFAHTSDKAKINLAHTVTCDGKDVKAVIAAGLKLSAKGQQMIKSKFSDEQSKDELEKGTQGDHPWIWNHQDANAQGRKYDYTSKP